jgi:hypothetical protein
MRAAKPCSPLGDRGCPFAERRWGTSIDRTGPLPILCVRESWCAIESPPSPGAKAPMLFPGDAPKPPESEDDGTIDPREAEPATRERGSSETANPPSSPPEGGPIPPVFPGSELLRGKSSREILGRIVEGDPFGMEERCVNRIRHHAMLLPVRRLALRSLARTATRAGRYQGVPCLADWLNESIDRSIQDLLQEEREEERNAMPVDAQDPRFTFLEDTLGLPVAQARKACIVFNDLPLEVRRSFQACIVDGKTINRYTAEGNGPPDKVESELRRALTALAILEDPGEDQRGGLHVD